MRYGLFFQIFALTWLYAAVPLQAKHTQLQRRTPPGITYEYINSIFWADQKLLVVVGFPFLYTSQNWDKVSGYQKDLIEFVENLKREQGHHQVTTQYEILGLKCRFQNGGINPYYAIKISHQSGTSLGWLEDMTRGIQRHQFNWLSNAGRLLESGRLKTRGDIGEFLIRDQPELHVENDNTLLIVSPSQYNPRFVIIVFPFLVSEGHSKMQDYGGFIYTTVGNSFRSNNPHNVQQLEYVSAKYTVRFKDRRDEELWAIVIRENSNNVGGNLGKYWHIDTARLLQSLFSAPPPGQTPVYSSERDPGRIFNPRLEYRKNLQEESDQNLRLWID